MAFHEIVAPTVKALFIQQIEGMILSGELRPGDRLPTERELADEMKISKTVVHEGLRELHRLGFVNIASRRGVKSLAEALFRYHRGVTFLSGNTITPLLFNAFTRVNLEFWKGYIRSEGVARCLERLAQFTEHIAAGDGAAAAQLLRTGLEEFMARME